MYWNNCWLNNFNKKHFLNKVIFIENLLKFLFTESIFSCFFEKKLINCGAREGFLSNSLLLKKDLKSVKKQNQVNKITKYNFTRVWFIKYNNYILVTTFVFFFFKTKRIKNKNKNKFSFILKTPNVFWKKKRSKNIKRNQFLLHKYMVF